MKAHLSLVLILTSFAFCPVQAQESREAYISGLRAAVKNPADSHDVYRRVIQPEFRTFLLDAAKKNDQSLAGELLSAYFGSRSHDSALSLAVGFGDAEVFKALLEHGADPNASNDQQWTPLHSAASDNGRPEMLKMLLDKGANPNARSFVGTTPLMQAAGGDARNNVIALIDAGAKVNARNNDGETALILAVKNNHAVTVKILLEAGANPRLKDDKGKIAADYVSPDQHEPYYPGRNIGGEAAEQRTKEFEEKQRADFKQIIALLENAKHPAIRFLAVSADGSLLASGDAGGELQIWDTKTGKPIQTLTPNEQITALALSPDGRLLSVGCDRQGVEIWTKQGNGFRKTRSVPFPSATALAFSPNGRILAAGHQGYGTIHLIDPATGEIRGSVWEASNGVTSLAFSSLGKCLLSGGVNAKMWDIRPESSAWLSKEPKLVSGETSVPKKARLWEGGRGAIVSVAVASQGMLTAGLGEIGDDGSAILRIWDAISGKQKRMITAQGLTCAAFLPDNQTIITGDKQGFLTLWNVETGAIRSRTRLSSAPILTVESLPNTALLAVGCQDGRLMLWDTMTKALKSTLIKPVGQ